jgi:histone H3/H4
MEEVTPKKTAHITKASITRLARRSGVKSMSDDCYVTVRDLINKCLTEIIVVALLVNSEHNTKTLMPDDIYEALRMLGHNVAQSHDLGTTTCAK